MIPMLHASSDEGNALIRGARAALPGLAVLTLCRAVLLLSPAFYLLLVLDVALPGHSLSSVLGLSGVLLLVLAGWAWLGRMRHAMLVHVGTMAQQVLIPRLDQATARLAEAVASGDGDETQVARDLDALEQFLVGGLAERVMDLLVLPVPLLLLLALHGWFALVVVVGAGVLAGLLARALRQEAAAAQEALALVGRRHAILETSRAHADAIRALGMNATARQAWSLINAGLWRLSGQRAGQAALRAQIAQGLRIVAVVAVVAIGAGLVLHNEASEAVVAAAALLGWLALAPLAQSIAQAGALVAARQGWDRLDQVLAAVPTLAPAMALAAPVARLACEGVAVMPPGRRKPVLVGLDLALEAGQVLAIIGPGGSGKSAALRTLAGGWEAAAGAVRLDGAALPQWDRQALARHIGYLPQGIELLDGTVAENIARFAPDADPQAILSAAREAGAHDMILRLPEGYATRVGRHGRRLSLSEAQRVGLARALFGQPFLIALDEPTAHLDAPAQTQLAATIAAARARGAVVVLAGSAPALMAMASHALILRDGAVAWFGDKQKLQERTHRTAGAGLRPVAPPKAETADSHSKVMS